MRIFVSLLCGAIFGAGLYISGMIDPQKVLGFLDIWAIADGGWDPSLAFVMGGGLIVAIPFFQFAKNRDNALCGGKMGLPTNRRIDRKLIVGGLLFGTGWGLVGYCRDLRSARWRLVKPIPSFSSLRCWSGWSSAVLAA